MNEGKLQEELAQSIGVVYRPFRLNFTAQAGLWGRVSPIEKANGKNRICKGGIRTKSGHLPGCWHV